MKKYDRENYKEENRLLVFVAFICMGLCFIMLLSMLSREPRLQATSSVDLGYSKISVSNAESDDNSVANDGNTSSATAASNASSESVSDAIININTANKQELMTLNGIGEVYAQRIIEYRESNGDFTSIEELTEVKGIGEKTLEKIKDRITV